MSKMRNYLGIGGSHFFGVLHDNFLKQSAIFLCGAVAVAQLGDSTTAAKEQVDLQTNALVSTLFFLPFIAFAWWAALASDRLPRDRVMKFAKLAELLLALPAAWITYQLATGKMSSVWGILACVTAIAVITTFFSPARLGAMPQLFPGNALPRANGFVEMLGFVGIIFGMGLAGSVTAHPQLAILIPVFAFCGWIATQFLPRLPTPERVAEQGLVSGFRALFSRRALTLASLGEALFYSCAVLIIAAFLSRAKFQFEVNDNTRSLALVCLTLGIGAGCGLGGWLSRGRAELGLVPFGALGLIGSILWLALIPTTPQIIEGKATLPYTVYFALTGIGVFGGLFAIPLKTWLQEELPESVRGGALAANNLVGFVGMLGASLGLYAAQKAGNFDSTFVLYAAAGLTTVACAIAFYMLPQFIIRFVVVSIARTIYRMRCQGIENVPTSGAVLLLPNHVTWADGMIISAAVPRPVRFMIGETYYNKPGLKQLFQWMDFVPVPEKGAKATIAALEAGRKVLAAGEVLCIFPEGKLTRSGRMNEFRAGFTRMIPEGTKVVKLPILLGNLWGAMLSMRRGERLQLHYTGSFPWPADIRIGKPLSDDAGPQEAQAAVADLELAAETDRARHLRSIPSQAFRTLSRAPFDKTFAEGAAEPIGNAKFLIQSLALRRLFIRRCAGDANIGMLLPNCVPAAAAALGAWTGGKNPVFLNATMPPAALAECLSKAGIRRIISSKLFIAKLKIQIPEGVEVILLEEVAREITGLDKAVAVGHALLPALIAERTLWRGVKATDMATVLFSSGSTGSPKGVMLSHRNLLSNVDGIARIIGLEKRDTLLGSMPYFHSFGFVSALVLPLACGTRTPLLANPLDAGAVGETVAKHKCSLLFGTPTFFGTYIRRCNKEQFSSIRIVLSGAEKLRPAVAETFYETFGIWITEAFGTTELSPGVSVNVTSRIWELGKTRGKENSVGQPILGVRVKIVDPEDSSIELPVGSEGRLLVSGNGVMLGYINEPDRTAKVLKDGWYDTGDIAKVDAEGSIFIVGRLARFSKIGGEMVPHGAVEDALHEILGASSPMLIVTCRPDPSKGERLAVIHATLPEGLGPSELSKKLQEKELPNLWIPKPADFILVELLPMLGSGKADLGKAKELAAAKE